MRRSGILHAELNRQLSLLGHTDTVVLGDAGLPIPRHVPVVDLAVVLGLPRLRPVLDALLEIVVVEGAVLAEEARSGPAEELLLPGLPEEVEWVSHAELKARCADAAFAIRTGETTPYANVILRSGVPF